MAEKIITETEYNELQKEVAALRAQIEALELSAAAAMAEAWRPVGDENDGGSCQCAPSCGTTWRVTRGMLGVTASDGNWVAVRLGEDYAICKRSQPSPQ